jgi:nitroreductase
MPSLDVLKNIIAEGALAPSGDNSQPWAFRIQGEKILVIMEPHKDNKFLNFRLSGTLVAVGAVLENMRVAAHCAELDMDMSLFPDDDPSHVALLSFFKSSRPDMNSGAISLTAIRERVTTRGRYQDTPIPPDVRIILDTLANEGTKARAYFIENADDIRAVGHAMSEAEIAILENEELHHLLFSNVVWTEKDEKSKRTGLFVKTLQMSPPQEFVFWICRSWNVMRLLGRLGFARFIAHQDAQIYSTASLYIAVIAPGVDRRDFVQAGMMMERLWLTATMHGLSVHPITTTLFFGQRIESGEMEGLTERHWDILRRAYESLLRIFRVKKGECPVLLLRVGYAPPPRARSSKMPPKIIIE